MSRLAQLWGIDLEDGPASTGRAAESRPGHLRRECDTCGSTLPDSSRSDRKYCSDACRRLSSRESGRVASVRRLKSGKMSVVIHMGDCGFRPGDQVKVGK